MKRTFNVILDRGGPNEQKTTYEGFNCNPEGARYRLEVDGDLAVGPFYCGADLGVAACALIRYLEAEYGRGSNPKVFDLWFGCPVGGTRLSKLVRKAMPNTNQQIPTDCPNDPRTVVERYAAAMSRSLAAHKEEQIKSLIEANYKGGFGKFTSDIEGLVE